MSYLKELKIKLNSLVIFKNLLCKKTIASLYALLDIDNSDISKEVKFYSEFVSKLFSHTENFSEYILKFMVEDENLYIEKICKKEPISQNFLNMLENEINILQELSLLESSKIRECMDYQGYLPKWETSEYDFANLYKERIEMLPKKGFGIFARYHVFTIDGENIKPVKYPDPQKIEDLIGYELERGKVFDNTKALLKGEKASNVLLYGDAGTGKSSSVKAICNKLKDEGLRLIEVKKNQLYQIPSLIDSLSLNPLKFILFIDDLSFSSNDNDFSALKAILEGSVTGQSKNIVLYATSNRRHLVKENFADRNGDEVHLTDTLQETTSLSARFGLKVTFSKPDKDLYDKIVLELASMYGIEMQQEELLIKAQAHALRNSGRSPRVAKQFIEQLKNLQKNI